MNAPLQRLLGLLANPKPSGDGYRADCPACQTKGGLSLSEGDDGRVLLKCFRYEGGCDFDQIIGALGLQAKDLFVEKRSYPSGNRATVQPSDKLTIEEYAAAKGLEVSFLRSLGLEDGKLGIKIPYLDSSGIERATRLRLALRGEVRFRWAKGAKPFPYGIWRLPSGGEDILLVEGESDCHTAWSHDRNCLGIPGADSVRKEWAELLPSEGRVLLVQEPDRGGDTFLAKVGGIVPADRLWRVRLGDWKDLSELHLADPERFEERLDAAIASAEPYTDVLERERQSRLEEAAEEAGELLRCPDILGRFESMLRARRFAGPTREARILYLALTSRVLPRPVSAVVKGPSSGGKSFLVETVLGFFPPESYISLTSMSERALVYDDRDYRRRFLVLLEATGGSGEMQSLMLRTLLSENRIEYISVGKDQSGNMVPVRVEKEGPTGLLTTTTGISLHPENETRLLSLSIQDGPDQTREILRNIAEDGEAPSIPPKWHALQRWLQDRPAKVSAPFMEEVAELADCGATRMRRDFTQLKMLVQAHAFLHQASREARSDGTIVADLRDYAAVYDLVRDLFSAQAGASVPSDVRETVAAVAKILGGAREGESLSNDQIARALGLDKSTASRRVRKSISLGFLQNLETGKGRVARIVLGEPLPEDQPTLPEPERLRGCTVAGGVDPTATEPLPEPPPLDEDDGWEDVA